jgi:predicted RNase H-like nuclease (RuvC/YqgF family)
VIVEKRVEIPVEVIKEVIVEKEVIKEVPVEKIVTKIEYVSNNNDQDSNKIKMLQTTIQNLTSEVRELKKKNEELEKKLLDTPKQVGNISAKFYGSSNLNDDLYK